MEKQLKSSVKELYGSVHAPKELKAKTLAAIEENNSRQKKSKLLSFNYRVWGPVAACLVLCLGLAFSGLFGNDTLSIYSCGSIITSTDAVINAESIDYVSPVMPASAKAADCMCSGTALKLEPDFDGELAVSVDGGELAVADSEGSLIGVQNEAEISGDSVIYIIMAGEPEITVTFTSKSEVKTLIIHDNSDGTFTVRVK